MDLSRSHTDHQNMIQIVGDCRKKSLTFGWFRFDRPELFDRAWCICKIGLVQTRSNISAAVIITISGLVGELMKIGLFLVWSRWLELVQLLSTATPTANEGS